MTTDTAELTARESYLTRELAVWRGRQARLPNYSLYNDPDFLREMGKMRGELERIRMILGTTNHTTPKRPCKRRAKES